MKISRRFTLFVKRIFLFFLVFGLLGGAVYLLFFADVFLIEQIDCKQDEGLCDSLIIVELERYNGKNSLLVDVDSIEKRIGEADRSLKSVEARVKLPDRLTVTMARRKPSAQVTTSLETGVAVLVDDEGIILGRSSVDNRLPVLIWPEVEGWSIEESMPEHVQRAVLLLVLATDSFSFLAPPEVRSHLSMKGQLSSGQSVLFSLTKDPLQQVRSLQVVVDQAKIDRTPSEIDLRFKNPVVVY